MSVVVVDCVVIVAAEEGKILPPTVIVEMLVSALRRFTPEEFWIWKAVAALVLSLNSAVPPAIRALSLAIVVAPFRETLPVPVLRAPVPFWVKLPAPDVKVRLLPAAIVVSPLRAIVPVPVEMLLLLTVPRRIVPLAAACRLMAPAPLPPWMRVVDAAALMEPIVIELVLLPPVTPEPMATVVLLAPLPAPMLMV